MRARTLARRAVSAQKLLGFELPRVEDSVAKRTEFRTGRLTLPDGLDLYWSTREASFLLHSIR
jgi:hypothetical protein